MIFERVGYWMVCKMPPAYKYRQQNRPYADFNLHNILSPRCRW